MAGMNEEQGGASGSGFDARLTLIVYVRVLSVVFLLSGLQNWARLIGLTPADGDFLALPTSVVVATLFFAVADLVAAVGLWLLASWGTVVWMICALTETALHGAFSDVFGLNRSLIVFHVGSVLVYAALTYLYERSRDQQ
jgi:hypothetical protein